MYQLYVHKGMAIAIKEYKRKRQRCHLFFNKVDDLRLKQYQITICKNNFRVKCSNKNGKKDKKKNEKIEYHKNLLLDVKTPILIIL